MKIPLSLRMFVAVVLWCCLAQAQTKSASTAEVSGVVRGGGAEFVLHLEEVSDNPLRYYDGYEAAVQKDGSFHFEDIKPGTYRFGTSTRGFTVAKQGASAGTITLRGGEHRKGVAITMLRKASVCGRVTENGAPKKSWMTAYRYDREFDRLTAINGQASEDGTYRFDDLEPGTYYLKAYMTWYPGSYAFAGAKAIEVSETSPNACTYDIPLQYTGCSARQVSGRIARVAGDESARYRVDFVERNVGGASMTGMEMSGGSTYKAGDSFKSMVCLGEYDVLLSDEHPNNDFVWRDRHPAHKVVLDSKRIVIADANVNDVVLTPRATAAIAGEVRLEDIDTWGSCPGLGGQSVGILRHGDGQYQEAQLDDKRRFTFKNVVPGKYSVYLRPYLREAVYIKSIMVDAAEARGREIDVPEARSTTVVITLSGNAAKAAGHVSPDERGVRRWQVAWAHPKGTADGIVKGVSPESYTLKLIPARFNSNATTEYTTHAHDNGRYRFENVDPGAYFLHAEKKDSPTVEYGAKGVRKRGEPLLVARGSRLSGLDLTLPKPGSICGRVTNGDGKPVAKTTVWVRWWGNGQWHQVEELRFITDQPKIVTDSNGRFRADGLAAADYWLSLPGQPPVYFSPDGRLATAKPVSLAEGQSVGCGLSEPLELQIPRGWNQRYAVSGGVTGTVPTKYGDRLTAVLSEFHPSMAGAYIAGVTLDDTRTFRFDSVPNGKFKVELYGAYGPEPMMWSGPYGPVSPRFGSTTLEVRGSDVSKVMITPVVLPSVRGTVRYEGVPSNWKGFDIKNETVTLVPREYRAPFSSKLLPDGKFSIDPEDPGDYEVWVGDRAPLYIRSVRVNGQEVTGRYLRLGVGTAADVEVDVSGDGGKVDVEVGADPSLPKPEPPVRETCRAFPWPRPGLVLIPEPLFAAQLNEYSTRDPKLIFGRLVGDSNREWLQASGVRPGRYRALVAEHLPSTLEFLLSHEPNAEDERVWTEIAELGVPIDIGPGTSMKLSLVDRTVDVARITAKYGLPVPNRLPID